MQGGWRWPVFAKPTYRYSGSLRRANQQRFHKHDTWQLAEDERT